MSLKGEVLYVKGMDMSGSDQESEDVWDDVTLTDAYEKAYNIAKAEVAKRLAMATNTDPTKPQVGTQESPTVDNTQNTKKSKNKKKNKHSKKEFKAGMPCRAVYSVDGREYEAFVMEVFEENECVVRYLGYDNEEVQQTSMLKSSLGERARAEQIQLALEEKLQLNDCMKGNNNMDCDNESGHSTAKSPRSRKEVRSKKKNHGFTMPEGMPFAFNGFPPQMPHMNASPFELPVPPPMPFPLRDGCEDNNSYLSSMLLSWYMSGYYTGLYQGSCLQSKNPKRK